MKILIKSVRIFDEKKLETSKKLHILIDEKGIIEKISSDDILCSNDATKIIEMKNAYASIGWFDTSVCFGEPGFEEDETLSNGLNVAAKSGFTDILLNGNTFPIPDNSNIINSLIYKSKGYTTSLYPIGAFSQQMQGKKMAELYDMHSAGAKAFADYKKSINCANLLKTALLYTQSFGGVVISFPQESTLSGKGMVNEHHNAIKIGLEGIPALSEIIQIKRDIEILSYTGGKLHIPTISTKEAVVEIKNAKERGLDITCSTSIHHLVFTDDRILDFDVNAKVQPPLRTQEDLEALKQGLEDKIIDYVTTDHSPKDIEKKKVEFERAAYGTIGLENAFGTLNTLLGMQKSIYLLTKGRTRFGIETPKIKEGEKANITLFNPDEANVFKEKDILSKSKNSIFIGHPTKGKVYGTYANQILTLK